MFATSRSLFAVLTVAMVALTHARADDRPLGRERVASIQEATRDLAREVEFLQDIVAEQSDKERTLYRQADAVLAEIVDFQECLKPETSREQLYKSFDELDDKLHKVLKAVQALGPEQRVLQRSAARMSAADEDLHFALSAQDGSEARAKQVLERQTRALATAARQVDNMAEFTLGAVQGRGVLVRDLHKLAEAAE